jgi:hypothetical protein
MVEGSDAERNAFLLLAALITVRSGWSHHSQRRQAVEARIERLLKELFPEGDEDG